MNAEKFSTREQWHERTTPHQIRPWSKHHIEEFRRVCVTNARCDDEDISVKYQRLRPNDENKDHEQYVWLVYTQACILAGVPTKRPIFKFKVPMPEGARVEEARAADVPANVPASVPASVPTTAQTQDGVPTFSPLKPRRPNKPRT